jgi:ABC-type arginine transport system ATPase subunit
MIGSSMFEDNGRTAVVVPARSARPPPHSVAIARATHWASKLILLDEPTAALGVAKTAGY